jgi:formylglycine-generating enzyme required for sulfatase activity
MKSFLCIGMLLFASVMFANNITVTNVALTGQDVSAGFNSASNFALVQFDLNWDNSWRTANPPNWDAAWVFVKFRLGSTDYLSAPGATNSGTTVTVQTTNGLREGMPVFVQSGTGAFAAGTVITSIDAVNNTFTVSAALTTPLSNNAVVRAERIWEHAWLNDVGHDKGSLGASASLQVGLQDENAAFNASSNPALGAYFYRSGNASGTYSTTGAKLRWNYGQQGIRDQDIVDVKVFAVEMVHVPTAAFDVDTALYYTNTSLLLDGDGLNAGQNNTFLDGSTNNATVTRFGNTTQGSFSPFCGGGGSAYFDGSGDYLTLPSSSDFSLSGSVFTIDFWVYRTSASDIATPIQRWAHLGPDYLGWRFDLTSNGTISWYVAGGTTLISSSGALPLNTWTHIAVSSNGTQLRLFVNGDLVAGPTNMSWTDPAIPLTIGALNYGTAVYPLFGFLSNVRIIKGTQLYTSSFTPPSSPVTAIANTVLLLDFENASIEDNSQKNNLETVGDAQTSTTQSKFGGSSMYFDGSGDYLKIDKPSSNLISWHTQDFTIEAWVYLTGNPQNSPNGSSSLISNSATSGSSEFWSFGPLNNRTVRFYYFNGSQNALTTTTALNLNQWHHLAFVLNGSSMTIYIDGVSSATSTVSGTPQNGSSLPLTIGQTCVAFYNGYIEDLRINNGTALYTANFTPPAAALSMSPSDFFEVNAENQLTLGGATPDLQYRVPNTSTADDFNASTAQTLPAAFPKGYTGFYAMKYQVGQNQWREFFNTLSSIQKTARDLTDASGKNSDAITFRNNLNWTSGDATLNGGTHGAVACNYLSWMDGLAYADWAGLRPMTELEYEKAGRGTVSAQSGETATGVFCPGRGPMIRATGLSNSGNSNETASNGLANAAFGNPAGVQGPMRVGAFATGSSLRSSAGASFYGIMELSGNLWEQVVTFGNTDGRNFTPVHGNGALTTAGHADVSAWPGYVSTANTGATGSGRRGGSWEDVAERMCISDRFQANSAVSNRNRANGFRAVRSLPSTPAQ